MSRAKGFEEIPANGATVCDVVSPWAGVGPPAGASSPSSETRFASYLPFGKRVALALEQLVSEHVGSAPARAWVEDEIAVRGEPVDLVSALAFGQAVVARVPGEVSRAAALRTFNEVLLELRGTSVVPPPVHASSRPSRNPDLNRRRCGNGE